MNYRLAGSLILLGTVSGIIFSVTYLLRDYFPESRFARRLSRLAKETLLSLSGQSLAISMILLGEMGLANKALVYLAWFGWFGCFLKLPFIVAEYLDRSR
jgi:hypothetical protein